MHEGCQSAKHQGITWEQKKKRDIPHVSIPRLHHGVKGGAESITWREHQNHLLTRSMRKETNDE